MNRSRLDQVGRTRNPILGKLRKVEPWGLGTVIEGMKWTVHGRLIRRFIGHFNIPWCTVRLGFGLLGGFSRFIMAEMTDVALNTSCTRSLL